MVCTPRSIGCWPPIGAIADGRHEFHLLADWYRQALRPRSVAPSVAVLHGEYGLSWFKALQWPGTGDPKCTLGVRLLLLRLGASYQTGPWRQGIRDRARLTLPHPQAPARESALTDEMISSLTVDDLQFDVRWSALRKTLQMTVDRGGELIISTPHGCDEKLGGTASL